MRAVLRAKTILDALADLGVSHLLGIPDNASAPLFDLMRTDNRLTLLTVTREAEAFGVAAGLWIGGKTPVVLIQNTGFAESGDGFRGTVMRMRVPLLCLITYRGFARTRGYLDRLTAPALDEELLSRPELDSAALVFEPTLKAWGLEYGFLESDGEIGKIAEAFWQAERRSRPTALLIPGTLSR